MVAAPGPLALMWQMPFVPMIVVGHVILAAGLLTAVAEQLDAVGVLEDDGVVVEDVAVVRRRSHLPSADDRRP